MDSEDGKRVGLAPGFAAGVVGKMMILFIHQDGKSRRRGGYLGCDVCRRVFQKQGTWVCMLGESLQLEIEI